MNEVIYIFNKSVILLSQNRIIEGKKELEKLIIYDDKNMHALNLLSLCEYRYCNFEMSKYYIDRSLSIKKSEKSLKYKKEIYKAFTSGFIYEYSNLLNKIRNSNYKNIVEQIEKIKLYNDNLIEPYILSSLIYLKNKNLIKARREIAKAYSFDRSNPYINNIYLRLKI